MHTRMWSSGPYRILHFPQQLALADFKLSILQLQLWKTSHTLIERFGTSDITDTSDALQITPDFTPVIWSIWTTSPRGTRDWRIMWAASTALLRLFSLREYVDWAGPKGGSYYGLLLPCPSLMGAPSGLSTFPWEGGLGSVEWYALSEEVYARAEIMNSSSCTTCIHFPV